jgi:uncharacterized protein (TIGR02996 family)
MGLAAPAEERKREVVMKADEARLQAHLDEHPDDKTSRQVLADLLEEEGRAEAAGFQRWLAARGLWPDNDLAFCGQKGWHWWSSVDRPHRTRSHAVVPLEMQIHMPPGEWIFDSRGDAEAALMQARALLSASGKNEDVVS